MTIREEALEDRDAVRRVNVAAFGGEAEADLVEALRAAGDVRLALVAEEAGEAVGHILFSAVRIDAATGSVEAASLAPLAVLPAFQRRGIGSALAREGLRLLRQRGHRIVIVLGHPEFYRRFGFSAALARRLTSPYSSAGEAWMALELEARALDGVSGEVLYPAAFRAL